MMSGQPVTEEGANRARQQLKTYMDQNCTSENNSVSPLDRGHGHPSSGSDMHQLSRQNSDSLQGEKYPPTFSPSPSNQSKRKNAESFPNSSVSQYLNQERLSNEWSTPSKHKKTSGASQTQPAMNPFLKAMNSKQTSELQSSTPDCCYDFELPDTTNRNPVENTPAETTSYSRQPSKKPKFVSMDLTNFNSTRNNVGQSMPGSGGTQSSFGNGIMHIQQNQGFYPFNQHQWSFPQTWQNKYIHDRILHFPQTLKQQPVPTAWAAAGDAPYNGPATPQANQDWGPLPQEHKALDKNYNRRWSEPMPNPDGNSNKGFDAWCQARKPSGGADADGSFTSSLYRERMQSNSRYERRSWTGSQNNSSVIKKYDDFTDWMNEMVEDSKGYENKYIDSHCHIDFIYKRLKISAQKMNYTQFMNDNAESWPVNYEGCVAVFCKPYGFANGASDDRLVLDMLQRESYGVWFAIGCHPKSAQDFTETHKKGLCELLRNTRRVVALGEIGLDYSKGFDQYKETQQKVLRDQLKIAVEWNLPLVIHCRDADNDLLDILQEIVPREHKIHAHCFMQNWEMAQRWMALFPNLFIGLTPVISYTSAWAPIDTAKNIPLNKLLLETDAPYFVPGVSREGAPEHSHPGFALYTAQLVARYQGVPVDQVLKACRENTRNMYGI